MSGLAEFAHLHVASSYSMRYGTASPAMLAARARESGMPALALTDRDGLYGAVKHAAACRQAEISPILGVNLALRAGTLAARGGREAPGVRGQREPGRTGIRGTHREPGTRREPRRTGNRGRAGNLGLRFLAPEAARPPGQPGRRAAAAGERDRGPGDAARPRRGRRTGRIARPGLGFAMPPGQRRASVGRARRPRDHPGSGRRSRRRPGRAARSGQRRRAGDRRPAARPRGGGPGPLAGTGRDRDRDRRSPRPWRHRQRRAGCCGWPARPAFPRC